MLTFREFSGSDKDYEKRFALNQLIWPDSGWTIDNMRHDDKVRNPKHYYQRTLAEIDGEVVGIGMYCESFWNKNPDQYKIWFGTHPDYERRGIASAYYDLALDAIRRDRGVIKSLSGDTREDKPAGIRFLEKRGYVQNNRYPRSELRLDDFDPAPFAHYGPRMEQHGIKIQPLSDLIPNDPDWQRKLWDLEWVFEQDEPTPDPPTRQPFDEYVKDVFGSKDFMPEGWMIATDGDRYAGLTSFWPDKIHTEKWHTGWTGVDRPYRKKGIAMAMKLKAIELARQHGLERVETDNHETNWMYQINVRLGFKPLPAYLSYEKKMEG